MDVLKFIIGTATSLIGIAILGSPFIYTEQWINLPNEGLIGVLAVGFILSVGGLFLAAYGDTGTLVLALNNGDKAILRIFWSLCILSFSFQIIYIVTDKPRQEKFRIDEGYNSRGKFYFISYYSLIANYDRDWSGRGWSRIDFHDYYTREEAEYSLKHGEPGHRR